MPSSYRVLIADDDSDIRDVLRIPLENNNCSVIEAGDGFQAVQKAAQFPDIDLFILDIMMPRLSGLDACAEIRKISSAPILFLTARSKDSDKSVAYQNGGDDYLVKPFSQSELLMKVLSLLRRYTIYKGKEVMQNAQEVQVQDLTVDLEARAVWRGNQRIELTEVETNILMYLVKNRGTTQNIQTIYTNVWQEKYMPSAANTVMVHIYSLRKKLEKNITNPLIIRTVWGKGYQLYEK